jgi:multicomponent Na+:H+ antiporter subunit F
MIQVVLWGLLLSAFVGFWRVMAGPTIPDRIVAADALSIFLDIALAFAVLAFADVLIMAKYFEHGELHR